jgi:hypothetical protein
MIRFIVVYILYAEHARIYSSYFFFFFVVLVLELGAFTLSHSTSPIFMKSFLR